EVPLATAPQPETDRDRTRESRRPRLRRERSAPRPEPSDDVLDVKWTVESPAASDATFSEIFVNLGRRDGVHASDFLRVLADVAEIPQEATGRIRVRDHSSFVSVKREMLDKAVSALNGAAFSGKVAQAEPAR